MSETWLLLRHQEFVQFTEWVLKYCDGNTGEHQTGQDADKALREYAELMLRLSKG